MLPVPNNNAKTARARLPFITFRYRALGMGLGGLPIAVVLVENHASWPYWVSWLFTCYLWPPAALYRASKSQDPFLAERSNLIIDSFIAGLWVAFLHFNLLPSAMLLAITIADKISTGIRRLWLYSLPSTASGILVGGLITGFAFQPHTSMSVIFASLPIMILHTLAVSLGTFHLVRKVSRQNQALTVTSQTDYLTGLFNHGHWQKLATEQFNSTHSPNHCTLVLLDVDRFKAINDSFGHSVGNDVLQAISQVITHSVPAGSITGRLGGDEFAVILPVGQEKAQDIANRIKQKTAAIRIRKYPKLRCSVSFGLASHKKSTQSVRQWFDIADRNLYTQKFAKHQSPSLP